MQQVALVTGGSRGIGAEVALLLGGQGYAVGVNYLHNRAAADVVVAQIRQAGGRAVAIAGDVGREADVLHMFAAVEGELGPLTALVNNAGILEQQMRLDQMELSRMQQVIQTNIIGAMLCAREAVRRMSPRHGGQGGAIVNVSSRAAALGAPGEYVDYAATKGALDSMTIGLAKEVAAEGIRVNSVRPGIIETEIHARGGEPARAARLGPQIPMQRSGTAREVAHAIVWLLSDQASYITGALLDIGGGR